MELKQTITQQDIAIQNTTQTQETPLFETHAISTRQNIKEGLNKMISSKFTLILFFIVFPIMLGLLYFMYWFSGALTFLILGIILSTVFVMITIFLSTIYKATANTVYLGMLEQNNGSETASTTRFFESHFVVVMSNGNILNLPYDAIAKTGVTQNLLVMMTKGSTAVFCEKEKFSIGDSEGLMVFLKSKTSKKGKKQDGANE